MAIEAAAQAIHDMLQWRQKRKFLSPQQLRAWESLVRPKKQGTVLHALATMPIASMGCLLGGNMTVSSVPCCQISPLFMTLQMSWQGQDSEGHPLLVVHIGRMCNECQSHELAQQAADALISEVGACRCY